MSIDFSLFITNSHKIHSDDGPLSTTGALAGTRGMASWMAERMESSVAGQNPKERHRVSESSSLANNSKTIVA